MEPPDRQEHDQEQGADPPRERDQEQGADPPREGGPATGNGGPMAPQVIGTDDPLVASGPASQSGWTEHPDRSMVVETGKIREPNQAFNPNFVMVPVESDRSSRGRAGAGNEEQNVGESEKGRKGQAGQEGQGKGARPDSRGGRDEHGRSAPAPSLMKILLLAGAVALVCGVAGAWGYSYFFGPDKSGDQKSSGSDSGGDSGSSKGGGGDSGSSKGGGEGSGSSKGSDTRKNSTSNEKGPNGGKLLESQQAWLAAVKELHAAQDAEKAARGAEEDKKTILNFLKNTLLSAGRPGDGSLSAAFWAAGQGKDVTLRKALDSTESRVGETFADRPMVEAEVREMLGLAYLNVGEATKAVQQYQRALALREATQGATDPDAAACRNQLAVAYRLADRTTEAGRLFDRNPNSPAHAAALAARGSMLLLEKKPAEAELKLRESLTVRRKIQPDDWATFDTESTLGEALLEQKKFAEAEPLLVSGYEGLRQRVDKIPNPDRPRLTKALERLVKLYGAWGRPDQAATWRAVLKAEEALPKS